MPKGEGALTLLERGWRGCPFRFPDDVVAKEAKDELDEGPREEEEGEEEGEEEEEGRW